MATTAVISDAFQIVLQTDAAAGHVLTNPGRAYKITGIRVFNAGGTPNITVASPVGDVVTAVATLTNAWKDCIINLAAVQVGAGQDLTITNAATSTTCVVVDCVASAGFSMAVT